MLPPLSSSIPVSSAWSMPACTLSARRGWPLGCRLLQLRIPVISWEETNLLCQRRWSAQPFAKTNISPALSGESKLLRELFVFASFKELMNVPPRTNILRGGCEEGQQLQELPSWLLVPLKVSFFWHRGIYPSLSALVFGAGTLATWTTHTWGLELASQARRVSDSDRSWEFLGGRWPLLTGVCGTHAHLGPSTSAPSTSWAW